jgi:hypothetical protein
VRPSPSSPRAGRRAVAALVSVSSGLALAGFTATESLAAAEFRVPSGYGVVDLGFDNVDGFGVSADGRLVTAVSGTNDLTITLYDTYKTGRTQLGRVSLAGGSPLWATDLAFDGRRVVFGENRSTNTVYSVDFGSALPTVNQLAPAGSLPGVQDVTIAPGGRVLASGFVAPLFAPGGLYLKTVSLSGGGTPATVVDDVPNGYVGGAAVTPDGGGYVLLDSRPALRLFDPATGAALDEVSLAAGNGWSAYAIAFDGAGLGYVTSGHTITLVDGLGGGGGGADSPPAVSEFGGFDGLAGPFDRFLAGIEFTGGAFRAGHADDTGALIFADGTIGDEGLFAIVPVPEPTGLALLAVGGTCLLARRRRGGVR